MPRTAIIFLSIAVFHFGGMVVFIAALDAHGGCDRSYLDQPDYCLSYKAGAGLWEASVLYYLIYSALKGDSNGQ